MSKAILQKGSIEGVIAIYESFYAISRSAYVLNATANAIKTILEETWFEKDQSPEHMQNVRNDICRVCKIILDPLYPSVDKIHFLDAVMMANDLPRNEASFCDLIEVIKTLALDDCYGSFDGNRFEDTKHMADRLKDIAQLVYAIV